MTSESSVEVSDTTWEKIVEKGNKPVMVMFSSPTCPHCRQMEPYFEEYAKEFTDKVIFAKVNVAATPTIASRYGIMGTPTFAFFCHGHPVQSFSGAVYPTIIKKAVEDGLKQGPECVAKTTWSDSSISGYA